MLEKRKNPQKDWWELCMLISIHTEEKCRRKGEKKIDYEGEQWKISHFV